MKKAAVLCTSCTSSVHFHSPDMVMSEPAVLGAVSGGMVDRVQLLINYFKLVLEAAEEQQRIEQQQQQQQQERYSRSHNRRHSPPPPNYPPGPTQRMNSRRERERERKK